MDENDWLAERFERHRPRLRAVAYRMLGSLTEADDAVQDAWLRLSRSDPEQIDNLGGWLTTVVARECLHLLRSRRRRREEPFATHPPDPVVVPDGDLDPEQEALLADSVGLALLIVLDRLAPAERLAFVLHDMFELPFAEIAGIVGRTPIAARQLASRARRRVNGADLPSPDPDVARQRKVVNAFYAAARTGDIDALVGVLDPDVVLRTDFGTARPAVVVHGARAVAEQARAPRGGALRSALVNGTVGAVITRDGRPFSVMAFTVAGQRIVRIDVVQDPDRVRRLASSVLGQ
ncbi:sigma-70 family RNA polymerase sigma factor [Amycolatopsis nigrescens]|uniref:sigma-70 family RNA polymerase sigma factor n=1 Tax=Amycolatopsis nigrescens TaxID=381445 RepID=UPI00037AF31A|nr:sigma-70 family RNA polymerase sigma factor [Amycolatopsis nigrescens]